MPSIIWVVAEYLPTFQSLAYRKVRSYPVFLFKKLLSLFLNYRITLKYSAMYRL